MQSIAVIGGGTMGTGIAYVSAMAGLDVIVVEPSDDHGEAMFATIEKTAARAVELGKFDNKEVDALMARVSRIASASELPLGIDLAIETVPERLDLKHQVLKQLAERKPRLIGTNTSAISIDALAAALPERDRFIGMHFFNPVWSFKLVELVRGAATSEETVLRARDFVARIGKESMTVVDSPGFATTRLDLVASLEAMRMLESGVASAADIDRAAELAYRHPVGPLRLSDIVGLDVRLDIARILEKEYGERFSPPSILVEKVGRGELGQKSGRGFFDWTL